MSASHRRLWESRLLAVLAKHAAGPSSEKIALIEIVDRAALWSDSMTDLALVLAGADYTELLKETPVLACCAASEIGYRFEGVGTVFWGRFEALLERPIPIARRFALADAFRDLSRRYALCTPPESAFSEHFSIMAWPIPSPD